MDIDRYIAKNSPSWHRLEALTNQANGRADRLSASELDELVQLYQRTSAHLSHVRARHDDTAVINKLSSLLAGSRQVIYGKRARGTKVAFEFFRFNLPGAMWAIRRQVALTTSLFLIVGLFSGVFLHSRPDALTAEVPDYVQDAIAESEFEDYYSSEEAGAFAAKVQINNIQVAFLAFGSGAAAGVFPLWMMFNEGTRIGTMAAIMHRADAGAKFWGLLLPHGLLELSAIFIAAGAGVYMGWALVSPGRRTRSAAFGAAANTALTVAVGTAFMFIVAGFIEAFVTPSGLPTALRIGIGASALATMLTYFFGLGPSAYARGFTGQLSSVRASWESEGERLDEFVA